MIVLCRASRAGNSNGNHHFPEYDMMFKQNVINTIDFVIAGGCPECLKDSG